MSSNRDMWVHKHQNLAHEICNVLVCEGPRTSVVWSKQYSNQWKVQVMSQNLSPELSSSSGFPGTDTFRGEAQIRQSNPTDTTNNLTRWQSQFDSCGPMVDCMSQQQSGRTNSFGVSNMVVDPKLCKHSNLQHWLFVTGERLWRLDLLHLSKNAVQISRLIHGVLNNAGPHSIQKWKAKFDVHKIERSLFDVQSTMKGMRKGSVRPCALQPQQSEVLHMQSLTVPVNRSETAQWNWNSADIVNDLDKHVASILENVSNLENCCVQV